MTDLSNQALRHREAIERRVKWQTEVGIPESPTYKQEAWIRGERTALLFALRLIDASPDAANQLAAEMRKAKP